MSCHILAPRVRNLVEKWKFYLVLVALGSSLINRSTNLRIGILQGQHVITYFVNWPELTWSRVEPPTNTAQEVGNLCSSNPPRKIAMKEWKNTFFDCSSSFPTMLTLFLFLLKCFRIRDKSLGPVLEAYPKTYALSTGRKRGGMWSLASSFRKVDCCTLGDDKAAAIPTAEEADYNFLMTDGASRVGAKSGCWRYLVAER